MTVATPSLGSGTGAATGTGGPAISARSATGVTRGDSLLLIGALFNATDDDLDSVYLRMTITYAEARRDIRHRDVLPLYLDVLPPGHRVFDVPPGEWRETHEWSPAIAGRIIALGGHLHQYGTALVLEDQTSGDTIWVGTAQYGRDGKLNGVSRKIFLRGVAVRPDHRYRITVVYHNPTDAVLRGAMGKIGGLFLPERGARVPFAERRDAGYVRDLHVLLAAAHAHH
jgi:hypothetical protein